MALIGKIREKSTLVLVLMVLAIGGFIFMLIMQDANPGGNSGLFRSNTTTVAAVAGQTYEYRDMQRQIEALGGRADVTTNNQLYNFFVEKALVEKEAAEIGLGVCKEELLDLEFNPENLSPLIASNPSLANPQTGVVDVEQLKQIQQMIQTNQMPEQGKLYWAELEKQIIKERLQEKMNNLVAKAVYTPKWIGDEQYKELTNPIDFEYVRVTLDRVEDKDITVTDADIEAYIKDNKGRYSTDEEMRVVDFVSFDVVPSAEDTAKVLERLNKIKADFVSTPKDKDSSFVVANGGTVSANYVAKDKLGAGQDSIFNAAIGSVVGPYLDGKAYFLAKLLDKKAGPDSVKSRHILIQPGPDAQKKADSIRLVLESNPAKWDSLNKQFNTDPSAAAKNGDLDWQANGTFVGPFNDLVFYKAQKGKYYTVASQFGVHVVQVTDVKVGKNETRVKVAIVREAIIPSAKTDRAASDLAETLLRESKNLDELRKNAQAKNYLLQTSSPIRTEDMSIGSLGNAEGIRPLVRWAYEASKGEKAKTVFGLRNQGESYTSRYVVAALKSVQPKGVMAVEDLREQLTPYVRNRKKAALLKERIGTVSDLNALASQYGVKVDTAKGVTFNATFVPGLGSEPKLMAKAFSAQVNQVVGALEGESGVFAIKVTKKETVTNSPVDVNILRQQATDAIVRQWLSPDPRTRRTQLVKTLAQGESIKDNRLNFF